MPQPNWLAMDFLGDLLDVASDLTVEAVKALQKQKSKSKKESVSVSKEEKRD